MMTTSAFEHFDAIRAAPEGAWLIVAEPVSAQRMPSGGQVQLRIGTRLRKRHTSGGLWCQADLWKGVEVIVIDEADLGAVELRPCD